MKNVKGMDVVVFCRYLFAVPVLGYITDVSDHDGAYEVSFYKNNPGGPNVTKHNGKFFLPEQCKIKELEKECLTKNSDPLSRQIGGNHYKDFAIQPVEFITKNRLTFLPATVIKRMCRYNKSSGKGLQDLQKAKHEIDLLIQLEGWGDNIDHGTVDTSEGFTKTEAL